MTNTDDRKRAAAAINSLRLRLETAKTDQQRIGRVLSWLDVWTPISAEDLGALNEAAGFEWQEGPMGELVLRTKA